MKTNRSTLRTMRLVILIGQLGLILQTEAQIPDECIGSTTNRPPENDDITVICGTTHIELSIYICPVYQSLYNESLMVLNNMVDNDECRGDPIWSVDPPILQFRIPINETATASCNNNYEVTSETGTGVFSDFSNVQSISISGTINSIDSTASMITYRSQITYKFSCRYPMQYLLNNTEMAVSGVNLAVQDNNGSFVSTLSMQLYRDDAYTERLNIPQTGLNLKTKIYVAVQAKNLTERFNVLLGRCYTTTTPNPNSDRFYNLFVGCEPDAQTQVDVNGVSQTAKFSFEAFRFVEHKNLTISTFYLHCVLKLCEVSSCSAFACAQGRRKREATDLSANTTVTSQAIRVNTQNSDDSASNLAAHVSAGGSSYSSPVVGVIVCIIILAILLIAMAVYLLLYIRRKSFME